MCFNVLVLMSGSGDIYVGALGTDPNLFAPPRPEARPINYEDSDAEMNKLNNIIKSTQTKGTFVYKQLTIIALKTNTPYRSKCYGDCAG